MVITVNVREHSFDCSPFHELIITFFVIRYFKICQFGHCIVQSKCNKKKLFYLCSLYECKVRLSDFDLKIMVGRTLFRSIYTIPSINYSLPCIFLFEISIKQFSGNKVPRQTKSISLFLNS